MMEAQRGVGVGYGENEGEEVRALDREIFLKKFCCAGEQAIGAVATREKGHQREKILNLFLF